MPIADFGKAIREKLANLIGVSMDPITNVPVFESALSDLLFGLDSGVYGKTYRASSPFSDNPLAIPLFMAIRKGLKDYKEPILSHERAHVLLSPITENLSSHKTSMRSYMNKYGKVIRTGNMEELIAEKYAEDIPDDPFWERVDTQVLQNLYPAQKRKRKNVRK